MESSCKATLDDFHLASRKEEEAVWRRSQAVKWIEAMVGPLALPQEPSEKDFITCLRNGLVLCNVLNKIHPGAVPRVVENPSPSVHSEAQPLLAYQYFENIRNFLVAMEELKLPSFEACDLEKDALEAGPSSKIVDCILSLKSYHEWRCSGGGNGPWKYARSPSVSHSGSILQSRAPLSTPLNICRHLDMSTALSENKVIRETEKRMPDNYNSNDKLDSFASLLARCLMDAKENIDENILASLHCGDMKAFLQGIANYMQEIQLNACSKQQSSCSQKFNIKHKHLLASQEKELREIKALLLGTKKDFKALHSQLGNDLKKLENQMKGLSFAASGYHKVLKDNRDLYNALQDLKGNIRVYCRIRPVLTDGSQSIITCAGEDGLLVVLDPLKSEKDTSRVFQFNKVFGPTSSQEEIFMDAQPLIRSVMDGYNVCIFAYGQTGSGKTHTMYGPSRGSLKDKGINYLALNDLFRISYDRKDQMMYEVQIQMVEIYNEKVRDLLAHDSSDKKLEIRTRTRNEGSCLPDASMHIVCSTMDVLRLMKLGNMNRAVSSTAANDRSSRSHSILTVHVHGQDMSGHMIHSCLHLVDLAGSERIDRSEVTGERLKETQHINRSLSCLGDVITALAGKYSHIPYRNSKLTQMLQDSLGGHAKTLMFAHVSPEASFYGETLSTLKFAQRVSAVELGASRLNKESCEIRKLREQVENLTQELDSKRETTKVKEAKFPFETMRLKNVLTPPRTGKLNPENQSTGRSQQAAKLMSRTAYTTLSHGRRLSLEVPDKPHVQELQEISLCDDSNMVASIRESPIFANPKSITHTDIRRRALQPPRSPEPSRFETFFIAHTDVRRRALEPPRSPEPSKSETFFIANPARKGYQIRKPLRTLGKVTSGSDRRMQYELKESAEAQLNIQEPNLPNTCKSKCQRRESLAAGLVSVPNMSRRASLGGKASKPDLNGSRNAKTPPPICRTPPKAGARWL